jgi:hypothetical protein
VRFKLCLSAAMALACFVWAVPADASQSHLKYPQAKHESRLFVEELCRQDSDCTAYGMGGCRRMSSSRIDCLVGIFYADLPKVGEETQCAIVLHWGIDQRGLVALKNYGQPNCSLAT